MVNQPTLESQRGRIEIAEAMKHEAIQRQKIFIPFDYSDILNEKKKDN